ncbi:formylglycine-generating enzyme family protein [bacterium]|nr:formylglycine-generating enzyme family protein [bacterium]
MRTSTQRLRSFAVGLSLSLLAVATWAQSDRDIGAVYLPDGSALQLTRIPAGSFSMGSAVTVVDSEADEQVPHTVVIGTDYFLGTYEVTKGQWEAVMGTRPWEENASYLDDPNSPATNVSYNDAQAFLAALNQIALDTAQGDLALSLPTEAEWEYACRAETQTRYYWGDDLSETFILGNAWFEANTVLMSTAYERPVGQWQANAWGLYDMSGNAREWCQDYYSATYYSVSPSLDPTGPDTGTKRVLRGGGWYDGAEICRSACRRSDTPDRRRGLYGFRILTRYDGLPVPTPSPTPTPTPSPIPTPYPSHEFTFTEGLEGWTAFQWPPFSAPGFFTEWGDPGVLGMTATNNEDLVGIWHSPPFEFYAANDGPTLNDTILLQIPKVDGTRIFQVSGRILTNEADPTLVPEVRLRQTALNSQHSDLLSVFSYYDGAYSPTPQGKEYTLYFIPPKTSRVFNCEFDLLGFIPEDSPSAQVMLDWMEVRVAPDNLLHEARLERSYDFTTGTNGWQFYTLEGTFDPASGTYDSDNSRLGIKPADNPNFQFGFWSSTTDPDNNVYIEPGRLYYANFQVGSDIEDPDLVPTFRLRLNTSLFRACQLTTVASTGTAENSPTPGHSRLYTVFLSPGIGVGQYLLSSFDLLAEPGVETLQPGGSVYLERVDIYSVPDDLVE